MAWTIKTYFVTSPTPIVIEEPLDGSAISYQPGATFQARENNFSVRQLLADGRIVEVMGGGQTLQGFALVTGQQGPTGPTGPAGTAEPNTSSNAGGDVGLALAKVVFDLPFRGLTAGTAVTLTPTATDVTIATTAEANTSSSAGGTVALPLAKSGADLPFRGLTAGTAVTLTPTATDVTIATTAEANTSSSAGGTVALPLAKSGADLPFRGLTAGAGIGLTPTATDVTIASTGLAATLGVANSTGGSDISMTSGDAVTGAQSSLDLSVGLDTTSTEVVAAINELLGQVALIAQVFS